MFESNLAGNAVVVLTDAANDSAIDEAPGGPLLSEEHAVALLESVTLRTSRRGRVAHFHDSGAALFRPFRIY